MIKNIPTNIITGFLGVGKSTAIMHLLASKPENERWAVLVNEFGEVGIDGGLFNGNFKGNESLTDMGGEAQDVFVREVPGGCMCCAAGLPMQIALNMLLAKAKPDRLLIEPTGLGHPKEVLSTLNSEHYKEVLSIDKIVTLVDARKIQDERYLNNQTFRQQLDIADVIVANKSDLYADSDYQSLAAYLETSYPDSEKALHAAEQGKLSFEWLNGATAALQPVDRHNHDHDHHSHDHAESYEPVPQPGEPSFPQEGYLSVTNQGEGFFSQGWIFEPKFLFSRTKLYNLLAAEEVERLKAIFITSEGILAFNKADDVLTEMPLEETLDSRIELITQNKSRLSTFEADILACIDNK